MTFKGRNKRKHKKIFILIIAVVIVLFIRAVVVTVSDVNGYGGNDNGVYIEIDEGSGLKTISKELKKDGIISNEFLFYLYAKERSEDFKFGGHIFTTAMSYDEICNQLCEVGTSSSVKVVVPEGYELRLIAKACEDADLCTADEFMNEAENGKFDYDFLVKKDGTRYALEGFLFPATYDFKYGTDAHTIIDKMLSTFDEMYWDKYSKRAEELGMSDYEIITLASIIEREAANVNEHKKVAGVFYNRIKSDMLLQSCATVQYILKERKPVLSVEDTKINSPYNTYIYEGLPAGPIASPGKSAIEAALYPEQHDYYYFVARMDRSGHVFSKTLEEHNRAVAENQ